jgi:hypothetical protein
MVRFQVHKMRPGHWIVTLADGSQVSLQVLCTPDGNLDRHDVVRIAAEMIAPQTSGSFTFCENGKVYTRAADGSVKPWPKMVPVGDDES